MQKENEGKSTGDTGRQRGRDETGGRTMTKSRKENEGEKERARERGYGGAESCPRVCGVGAAVPVRSFPCLGLTIKLLA